MADISKIKALNGTTYDIKDAVARTEKVSGPSSATANHIATFSDTTGKVIKDSGYTIATSVPSNAVFTDTKNTAGSTDTSSKIFLIGATSQAANPQTYSHDTAYVGTDGCLYSGGTKVLTAHQDISGKANKSGDTFSGTTVFNKSIRQIITGTGTAGTTGSSSAAYVPSKWTFDLGMTPVAGDIITIKIPVAGVNSGVWLSVDNGTTYYPVAAGGTTRFTTHFAVNYTITLIYQTGMTTATYGTTVDGAAKGASTTNVTLDRWAILNFYDTNTTYSAMSSTEMHTGTATSSRVMTAKNLKAGMEAVLKAVDGDVQLYGAHLTGQVPAPTTADNGKVLKIASGVYSLSDDANTDTKNTAGSTDTSSKIFLIGATSQAANPQTYSHDTAYVGTDGCLYSGGTKVLTAHQDISWKVSGPSSATANHIATFSDTTGKVIKDSGYTIATSVPSGAKFTDTVPTYTYDSTNQKLTISY